MLKLKYKVKKIKINIDRPKKKNITKKIISRIKMLFKGKSK
jgi:hypothetical protein